MQQNTTAPLSNGHHPPNQSQQEIARVAVGRGIRHSFSHPNARKPAPLPPRPMPSAQGGSNHEPTQLAGGARAPVVQASLSALKSNFQNSLESLEASEGNKANSDDTATPMSYVPGSMRRDDSLVDLAMIPLVDEGDQEVDFFSSSADLSFIDFPWQDPNAPSSG